MIRPVRIGGKVIDWRDSSVFDVTISTANTTIILYIKPIDNGIVTIDFGDRSSMVRSMTNANGAPLTLTHTYTSIGVFKISIISTVLFDCLNATAVSRYNNGLAIKAKKQKWIYFGVGYSTQDMTYIIDDSLKYVAIANSPIKIKLDSLNFDPVISILSINGTNPNLYGKLKISSQLNYITQLNIRASNSALQGVNSFYDIISHTPNCTVYDIESYNVSSIFDSTTNLADLTQLVKDRSMINFIMYSVNGGITGDASNLFKVLYEKPTFGYFNLTTTVQSVYLELGVQQNDFRNHEKKTIYCNKITGDTSNFNFKYKAKNYLLLQFLPSAFGNINSVSNITQDTGDNISVTISSTTVDLDVSYLKNIAMSGLGLTSNDNFSGDISTLGTRTMCTLWSLSSLNSYTITGWSGLINNIYNNRGSWVAGAKSFACSNVMKSALNGTYKAPVGFIKGGADGTPTTDRERIYVLVNNYSWTFTNI